MNFINIIGLNRLNGSFFIQKKFNLYFTWAWFTCLAVFKNSFFAFGTFTAFSAALAVPTGSLFASTFGLFNAHHNSITLYWFNNCTMWLFFWILASISSIRTRFDSSFLQISLKSIMSVRWRISIFRIKIAKPWLTWISITFRFYYFGAEALNWILILHDAIEIKSSDYFCFMFFRFPTWLIFWLIWFYRRTRMYQLIRGT